jgi:signal transduction histidine kinase
LQPARPDGDTKLPISSKERNAEARAPVREPIGERPSGELADSPRRLLTQDGLHVHKSRPPLARGEVARSDSSRADSSRADSSIEARPAREPSMEEPAREPSLLALVSSARHELRSPLQSIQGFADLLASESYGALGQDQRVFVEHIIQGSWDLSRALDACFDLIQAEAVQLPSEPFPASLRRLLEEALTIVENNGPSRFDLRLSELDPEFTIEVDLRDFSKAIEAVVTTLTPLARGRILVSAQPEDGAVQLTFAVNEEPRAFRRLSELPRRGVSARALLWLRLSTALLARSGGRLETTESYDQVRLLLPERRVG